MLMARSVSTSVAHHQVGTYLYASPEQMGGAEDGSEAGEVDGASDLYSVGIILYELFTPFCTAMERVVKLREVRKNRECLFQEEPEAARDGSLAAPANAGARPGWREQCMRLLHPDPNQRPSADAVRKWAQGEYELCKAQRDMERVAEQGGSLQMPLSRLSSPL